MYSRRTAAGARVEGGGLELTVAVNVATRSRRIRATSPRCSSAAEVAASALRLELSDDDLRQPVRRRWSSRSWPRSASGSRSTASGPATLAGLAGAAAAARAQDRPLVRDGGCCRRRTTLTIVRSIIDLGRNLGVAVVAEGVENAATWERLKVLGCAAAQGSHLSPPVPALRRDWSPAVTWRSRRKSGERVSNPRPRAWEARALPAELSPRGREAYLPGLVGATVRAADGGRDLRLEGVAAHGSGTAPDPRVPGCAGARRRSEARRSTGAGSALALGGGGGPDCVARMNMSSTTTTQYLREGFSGRPNSDSGASP